MSDKEESPKETDSLEEPKAPKRPARNRPSGVRNKHKPRPHAELRLDKDKERNDTNVDESSPVIQAFRGYQIKLDKKHDKYERLVKKSRDVTIESKRVIFLLHRITDDINMDQILKEAEEKLFQIRETSLQDIARELQDEDHFQYLRAISPGLQEYVEAVTFYCYIKNGSIATLSDIEKDLTFHAKESSKTVVLHLSPPEYMLGLADLSGELMRKGINSVAQGNMDMPFKLVLLLKSLYEGFISLGMAGREVSRKTHVLRQSLEKVERACYNINVRGSEIPKHMLTDVFASSQPSPTREAQVNIY